VYDLLACWKYAFVIIFIVDCVLVVDLLYAYKPKYNDIFSPGGIAYFSIGHYSSPLGYFMIVCSIQVDYVAKKNQIKSPE